jgi:hypothetical protein
MGQPFQKTLKTMGLQLISQLLPAQRRLTNLSETWGRVESSPTLGTPESSDNIIAATASRTVCVNLLLLFLSQGKPERCLF